MKLPNIEYRGDISKYVEASDDPFNAISYYKDIDYFSDITNYTKFVQGVEKFVRNSQEYSDFVGYIKNKLGINFCQVSSKIFDTDATIEMHHGPIFSLYDISSVILNWFIKNGRKINTFRVANKVIEEHYALRVQVVMLAVTNHELTHNKQIFLNISHGIGDINSFIQMYGGYFEDDQKYKVWNYINLSKENPSCDTGVLDVDNIKKYIKL